ncbi:MAG: pirin family protein [Vicinamibacterales bacterium]
MSQRSDPSFAERCVALGAAAPQLEPYPTKELMLGSLAITRALPIKERRLVGPWCFLDRFGPLSFAEGKPMDVAPHPHIGLQTVTWLLDGEIAHDDSLGSAALLRPGGVNVMTSGGGVAHTEQTPARHSGRLNGVQLWTALPDADRHGPASFVHLPEVPRLESRSGIVSVFAGSLLDAASGAPHFSPILGADLAIHARHTLPLPLHSDFEYAVLVLGGDATLDGQPLAPRVLYYMGTRRTEAGFGSEKGGRVLLVGGPPFPETILMWWNFVARTPDEIARARADWQAHQRFGRVAAYDGPRLEAPELLPLVRPEPVS